MTNKSQAGTLHRLRCTTFSSSSSSSSAHSSASSSASSSVSSSSSSSARSAPTHRSTLLPTTPGLHAITRPSALSSSSGSCAAACTSSVQRCASCRHPHSRTPALPPAFARRRRVPALLASNAKKRNDQHTRRPRLQHYSVHGHVRKLRPAPAPCTRGIRIIRRGVLVSARRRVPMPCRCRVDAAHLRSVHTHAHGTCARHPRASSMYREATAPRAGVQVSQPRALLKQRRRYAFRQLPGQCTAIQSPQVEAAGAPDSACRGDTVRWGAVARPPPLAVAADDAAPAADAADRDACKSRCGGAQIAAACRYSISGA